MSYIPVGSDPELEKKIIKKGQRSCLNLFAWVVTCGMGLACLFYSAIVAVHFQQPAQSAMLIVVAGFLLWLQKDFWLGIFKD